MNSPYLVSFDSKTLPSINTDILVIGSGIAGMSAALSAAKTGKEVLLLAKDETRQTATYHAQGGVAIVIDKNDSVELHIKDTLVAGSGLVDKEITRAIVEGGIERIKELINWGANFDKTPDGNLAMTREGAHSKNRILHANGDSTGIELIRTLEQVVAKTKNIKRLSGYVIDLLHQDEQVYGALIIDENNSKNIIRAAATVLATGGAGRLYRETTNPSGATGDGLALGYRAGAKLRDLEFVQFHPTALYLAGVKRMLISEAVRGEGAHLLNTKRERFMPNYHKDAELAPRDVVSVSITEEMQKTNSPHVYLDLKPIGKTRTLKRFPQIAQMCANYGLDITKDLVPVRPAAHYMMGGVITDANGATNIAGLYAAGEVGSSGLHGANRLASNSLLEGVVIGHNAGVSAASFSNTNKTEPRQISFTRNIKRSNIELDIEDVKRSLETLMERALGVFRDSRGLESAKRTLSHWQEYSLGVSFENRVGIELQNCLSIAELIAKAAAIRTESRGAHRRKDYPNADDANWLRHIIHKRGEATSLSNSQDAQC